MVPLSQNFVAEAGLGKGDEVLVAVEFPDDFMVADLVEIEERDLIPRFAWGAFVVNGVEMPVDRGTEIQVFIAEQIEAMTADFFGWGYRPGRWKIRERCA